MTENEFLEKYNQLDFNIASWKFMPPLSMKNDGRVIISGAGEINKNHLYYYYRSNLYLIDLDKTCMGWAGTLRDAVRSCLTNKIDVLLAFPSGNLTHTLLQYSPAGARGQVLINIEELGDFVFPAPVKGEVQEVVVESITPTPMAVTVEATSLATNSTVYKVSQLIEKNRAYKKNKIEPRKVFSGKHTNGDAIDELLYGIEKTDKISDTTMTEVVVELVSLLLEDIWPN
jgi:hypothetical protein